MAMKHIPEVNLEELKDYLKEFVIDLEDKQVNIPIIWSAPGIGKSCVVSEMAEEMKMKLVPFYASTADETEITGIPVPNEKDGVVRFLPLEHQKFEKDVPTIWFWDEINRARPEVLQALFSIVSSYPRRVGMNVIPDNVFIVCAANFGGSGEEGDGTIVTDFNDSSFFNKFSHIKVRFDKETLFAYLKKKYQKTNLSPAVANVCSFLQSVGNDLILGIPDDAETVKAYPTPRTVERFIKTFGKMLAKFSTDTDYLKKLRWGASIIGEKWIDEYVAFGKENLVAGGQFDPASLFTKISDADRTTQKTILDTLSPTRILKVGERIKTYITSASSPDLKKLEKNNWFMIFYALTKMAKDSAKGIISMVLAKPEATEALNKYYDSDAEFQSLGDMVTTKF